MKKLQKLVTDTRLVHTRKLVEALAKTRGISTQEAARKFGSWLAEDRIKLYAFRLGDPIAGELGGEALESLYRTAPLHEVVLDEACAMHLDDLAPLFGYELPDGFRIESKQQKALVTRLAERPGQLSSTETSAPKRTPLPSRPAPRDSSLLATIAALMAAWPGGTPPSGKDLEKAAQSLGLTISDDTIRKALRAAQEIAPSLPQPK